MGIKAIVVLLVGLALASVHLVTAQQLKKVPRIGRYRAGRSCAISTCRCGEPHPGQKTYRETVTAFAFDAGEGLSEHTAPFDALVLMVDGEAEITISGVTHTVKAADILMLPAHQPHAVKAVRKFKMILVMSSHLGSLLLLF